MFKDVHDMYNALCYSCENENKLVEICFIKKYINRAGGLNREGGLNKYLHLKRGAY